MPWGKVYVLCSVAHTKGHMQFHYACQLAHDIALAFDSCTIMCKDLQQQAGNTSPTESIFTSDRYCSCSMGEHW